MLRIFRDHFNMYFQLTIGAIIGAISVIVFLAPFDIAPSGVSGIAVMLNDLFELPIGLMIFILNIPIQIWGARLLPGGWRVVLRTFYVIAVYTIAIDVLTPFLPNEGIGDDVLLNTIFGGITGGISGGIVFRIGGTFGGTSTVARILQRRTGVPMSTTFLYTDTAVIFLAGIIFGWEEALFAVVSLFIGGIATDYVMEGPAVIRTGVIITKKPDIVSRAVMDGLARGMTGWTVQGMYSGEDRSMLYVSISRSQVPDLRDLVMTADPEAFLVIGQGHAAYGEGFKPLLPKNGRS